MKKNSKGELPSSKPRRRLKKWARTALYVLVTLSICVAVMWPRKVEAPEAKVPEVTITASTEVINEVEDKNLDVVIEEVVKEQPKKEEHMQKTQPKVEEKVEKHKTVDVSAEQSSDIIYGSMTGYGANCQGCSGITASGYDVRNTIWYNDATYGQVRVLAAPKNIPLYTVVRVSGVNGKEPFLAIVLDRGGAIKGTLFDLLCESEAYANQHIGRQKNVTYEIMRRGR